MAKSSSTHKSKVDINRRADQYNDPSHNYLHYWDNRQYEHMAEEMAIKKLLKNRHFKHAVDVGGGYGRLCLDLIAYSDKVTLAEPSQQQLDIAKEFLKGHDEIDRKLMQANNLKFADESIDLVTLIRVMHHLPDPTAELNEISRVLSKDGIAIIEMANYSHMVNRVKYLAKGKHLPKAPVDIRSKENQRLDEIAFVNHNPHTVIRQLNSAGLKVVKVLSVSNLRSTKLKKIVPIGTMLSIENLMQKPLAPMYFGPSIFFLVEKI